MSHTLLVLCAISLGARIDDLVVRRPLHKAVEGELWLTAVLCLIAVFKNLDFAETKIFLLRPVVSDVDKLSRMAEAVVAQKHGLVRLKLALEL
jgi:hypothetical protein